MRIADMYFEKYPYNEHKIKSFDVNTYVSFVEKPLFSILIMHVLHFKFTLYYVHCRIANLEKRKQQLCVTISSAIK